MPGPTLTQSEATAIETAIAAITAAQAERERPAQVATDDAAAIVALGVPEQIAQAAGAAGFRFRVDEYDGPDGRGWTLRLRLTRDGQPWRFAHHVGPEAHRDAENGWALDDDTLGGA